MSNNEEGSLKISETPAGSSHQGNLSVADKSRIGKLNSNRDATSYNKSEMHSTGQKKYSTTPNMTKLEFQESNSDVSSQEVNRTNIRLNN